MDDARRERLIEILGEAAELPAGDRAAFVERMCREDSALGAEAMALVGAMDRAGGFLGRPTMNPRGGAGPGGSDHSPTSHSRPAGWIEAAGMTAPAGSEQPGTHIGRYKLLQQIGEGGFGVVFMAEQREPVHRQVALKIIKLGMDTTAVVARFEQERQALAMMDHPGIARVLDGGATDSGRPYFVMELVRGDPIIAHCQRQQVSTRERLVLFAQACRAVQHAHTKGVIHRDLKPANILVTMVDGRAVPKVIDFGIAKAAYGRLTDRTLFTEFRQMIGTPEYMSPEQADNSGVDVDARTDVYSLGVVLYELLTGVTPLDMTRLRSAGLGELQRMIREEEPARPSTRLMTLGKSGSRSRERGQGSSAKARAPSPEDAARLTKLAKVVRGDLDWIVMRCLEKDRSRRYDTAEALAADVERHLRGEPVVAAPPSAAYLTRKFVTRHRGTAIVGGLIFVALVAGVIGTSMGLVQARTSREDAINLARLADDNASKAGEQARRADKEAAEARASARTAEAVNDLMKSMIAKADRAKAQGREDVTVREVMDAAAADLEQGVTSRDPRVQMALAKTIGETYWQLSLMEPAERLLRLHHRMTGEQYGTEHIEHAASALLLGGLLKKRGDLGGARGFYAEGPAL